MCNRRPNIVAAVAISTAALVLTVSMAFAREVQLGGIRLGQHTLRVMEVYGQPDGILQGAGQSSATAATAPAAGGAGAGAGMPGMGGPGGAGGAGGGMPGMPGGMMGGAGGPGGPGGGGMPGMMGAGGPGGAMPGMAGAGGGMMGGMMGAGATGGAQAAATGGSQNWFDNGQCPDWAAPVWMPMLEDETMYVYRKGANVIGFLLDRDGYVLAIALAGRQCNWARTALWNVKKSVKLGDDYNRLIARYGYPDSQVSFEPVMRPFENSTTLAAAKAEFGGIENATRDLILTYKNDNIEFVLNDMKIIRIHIWEPDAREPEARNVGGTAQGGGMAGAMGAGGMGGPMGMGGGMGGPGGGGQR